MTKRFHGIVVVALSAAAILVVLGMGMGTRSHHRGGMRNMMGAPPSAGRNPVARTERVLKEGKTIFDASCAPCHGTLGLGDGPAGMTLSPRPPDLRGAAAFWDDGQIAAIIQVGRGAMPGFRGALDDESIWKVVHYVRSLQR